MHDSYSVGPSCCLLYGQFLSAAKSEDIQALRNDTAEYIHAHIRSINKKFNNLN